MDRWPCGHAVGGACYSRDDLFVLAMAANVLQDFAMLRDVAAVFFPQLQVMLERGSSWRSQACASHLFISAQSLVVPHPTGRGCYI